MASILRGADGSAVAVGLRWPPNAVVRNTSLISKQIPSPNCGHAVTFVGYRCDGGRIENAVFIFRNSWGPSWGAGGYGFVTYDYVAANLLSCFVVELN